GFGLWLLDDAGGDHHLERGGDQAGPISAGADGFYGPPLAVMHGCADNGERSGEGDGGGGSGHGGCHDALLSCCLSVARSSSTTAPIRLAGASLGERRSACPISAGRRGVGATAKAGRRRQPPTHPTSSFAWWRRRIPHQRRRSGNSQRASAHWHVPTRLGSAFPARHHRCR